MEEHKYVRTYFDPEFSQQTWTCSKCRNAIVLHDSQAQPRGFNCQGFFKKEPWKAPIKQKASYEDKKTYPAKKGAKK